MYSIIIASLAAANSVPMLNTTGAVQPVRDGVCENVIQRQVARLPPCEMFTSPGLDTAGGRN